jgi:hypothetical protein
MLLNLMFDRSSLTWTIGNSPIIGDGHDSQKLVRGNNTKIYFYFNSDSIRTVFNDLKFGYTLSFNTAIVFKEDFPRNNCHYTENLSTGPLETTEVYLETGKTYDLLVWAEETSYKKIERFEIEVLIPPKPFDSWLWNGDEWVPPKSCPEPGKYRWIEVRQAWELTQNDE